MHCLQHWSTSSPFMSRFFASNYCYSSLSATNNDTRQKLCMSTKNVYLFQSHQLIHLSQIIVQKGKQIQKTCHWHLISEIVQMNLEVFSPCSSLWSSWRLPQNPRHDFRQKLLWALLWALSLRLYAQHFVITLGMAGLDSNFTNGFAPIVQLRTKSAVWMQIIIHVGTYQALQKSVSLCAHSFSAFSFFVKP